MWVLWCVWRCEFWLKLFPHQEPLYGFTPWCVVAAAKSLQSCPTLCDPIDSSPPGSPVPGILQTRTLEWVAISFSNAWTWKVKVKPLSRIWLSATPWTAAYQAPLSIGPPSKPLITLLTFIRFLLSVNSLVLNKVRTNSEAFPTFLTFKRLLCCTFFLMKLHKFQQLFLPPVGKFISFLPWKILVPFPQPTHITMIFFARCFLMNIHTGFFLYYVSWCLYF